MVEKSRTHASTKPVLVSRCSRHVSKLVRPLISSTPSRFGILLHTCCSLHHATFPSVLVHGTVPWKSLDFHAFRRFPFFFFFYSRILPHAPLLPPRPFPSSFFLPDASTSHTACRSKAVARSCGSKACEIGTSSFIFGNPCSQLVYRSAIFPHATPPTPSSRFPRARFLQILASSSSTCTEHVFLTRRCARRRVMRSTCVVLWSSRHDVFVSRPRSVDPNRGVSSLLGEETGGTTRRKSRGRGKGEDARAHAWIALAKTPPRSALRPPDAGLGDPTSKLIQFRPIESIR